jgi:hypothetical protein
MTVRPLTVALMGLLSGCIDTGFDPPSLVNGPRVLALTAEPPESLFGEDVVFEALVVEADGTEIPGTPGVEMRWMVCVSIAEILRTSGLGAGMNLDDNCDEGGDDLVRLETGGDLPANAARLPGTVVLALASELGMAGMGDPPPGAADVDPRVLQALIGVIAEVGVPLRVRLEVWRDGEQILTAFKRFAITQRVDPTTNPPPPRFSIDGVWLSARDGDPHRCVPEEGVAPAVAAETEVTFSPDENEEVWIEEYPVVGLDGTVQVNAENAYYSWFSTGGNFQSAITQRPERDVIWDSGTEPGEFPIWLVVRDGHLGSSYCRADVTVTAAAEE